MNKEQELRPCPFCGGDASIHEFADVPDCGGCHALGPVADTVDDAIAAWNRRSSDEQAEVVGPQTIETRNELAGFIEFINEDVPVIVRDLDAPAAILIDMNTRKVVGYRVYDPASPPAVAAGGVTEERVEAAAKAIFDTWSAQTSYWPPMTWEDAQRAAAHPADFPKMARIVPLCRAEARAALLAALAEREGWQPVTDDVRGPVTVCRFGDADHGWLPMTAYRVSGGKWERPASRDGLPYDPTHWQPLPTPPSRGEGV
jgi:Lar family restriction alleviation protein